MNVDLANAALKAARLHRDRFDMGSWYGTPDPEDEDAPFIEAPLAEINDQNRLPACGTVGCYAGFVVFMTAPVGTVIADGGHLYRSMEDAEEASGPEAWRYEDKHFAHAAEYAREQLGLTESQGMALFFLNDLEQVERGVSYLAEHPTADYDEIMTYALEHPEWAHDGQD
jgi:hypothetical protein